MTLLDLSASTCSHSPSLGFRAAGGWDDSIHAEIFNHLTVVVVGVGDAKLGQTQARGFAVPRRLQHVFRGQCGSSAVAEGKGILEELDDFGFGFYQ